MSRSTRAAGKSLATQDQIRSPLRRFFREVIRKQGLPGPNPCDDLGDCMATHPGRCRLSTRAAREAEEEARWAGQESTPTRPFTPTYAHDSATCCASG